MQNQRYLSGVLTAVGGLLALHLVGYAVHRGFDAGTAISTASAAQPESYRRDGGQERPAEMMDPTEGGMISAAEQRKMIIAELRLLNARLATIESRLGSGVNVSVTEMPTMQWPAQAAAAPSEPAEPAPAGTP